VEQDQGDEVQQFQDPTAYKPGDEVNGHVLGTDNVWHSMAAVQLTTPPLRYWGRYRKRWRKTYLVFAVLGPLSLLGTPGGASRYGLLDLLLAATVSAALVAVFVNLLVAIPPSARLDGRHSSMPPSPTPKGLAEQYQRVGATEESGWPAPAMRAEPGDDAAADWAARVATSKAEKKAPRLRLQPPTSRRTGQALREDRAEGG
jgi:hypothetical protein